MTTWHCISQCGACCHLNPTDRPHLEEYLSPKELQLYQSMVGKDGWCINFDHVTRKCSIYDQRPRFCRVQPDTFAQMYGTTPEEFNDFAIDCCYQQIEDVYGEESNERERYSQEVGELDDSFLISLTPEDFD